MGYYMCLCLSLTAWLASVWSFVIYFLLVRRMDLVNEAVLYCGVKRCLDLSLFLERLVML